MGMKLRIIAKAKGIPATTQIRVLGFFGTGAMMAKMPDKTPMQRAPREIAFVLMNSLDGI